MRVYVSRRTELYRKWYGFIFMALWSSAVLYRCIIPVHPYTLEEFCIAIIFMLGGIGGLYVTVMPSVLVIEGDKILLEGLFSSITYDFGDFKEVTNKGWSPYSICFTDGKSFTFYPESDYNWYYRRSFSEQERLVYINEEIVNIIKEKILELELSNN